MIAAMLIFVVLWLLSCRRAYYQEEALKTLRARCAELEQAVSKISSRELEVSKRESAVAAAEKSLAADRAAAHKELDRLSAQSGAIRGKIASEARNCQMLQEKENRLTESIHALQERQRILSVSSSTISEEQTALQAYFSAPKNKQQLELEFVRYVGFLQEQAGYTVQYFPQGRWKDDTHFHLSATYGNTCLLIHCKRWDRSAFIRESTIMQIHVGASDYAKKHPESNVIGVLYATCALSNAAAIAARRWEVEVRGDVPFSGPQSYPVIKCVKNQIGEKVYYLPVDRNYDSVNVDFSAGDFYAYTAAEAEDSGFRYAYRWREPRKD